MAVDPKRKHDIDYIKVLATQVQNIPAWKQLAEAARQILGAEVDDRRRKLEKIRDSVTYRKNDTLVNVDYTPEAGKPMVDAITGAPFLPNSAEPIQFRTATVKNVIQNLALYNTAQQSDYLDLEVIYKDRKYRWLMPFTWNQERDILLRNAYQLGFNFFNTKLSSQDLQRLVEFIQIYWNEAGADDFFMKFIGFVKNTRFELVALWTEGDAATTDTPGTEKDFEYPYLEPFNAATMTSVTQGGKNWETSHVQIEYDLAQFTKYYVVNLDDLEQLFYYFAPIILVLERVTGTLTVETPVHGMGAYGLTDFEYDIWEPASDFITEILMLSAFQVTLYEYAVFNTEREGCLGLDSVVNLSQNCFDFTPYIIGMGA